MKTFNIIRVGNDDYPVNDAVVEKFKTEFIEAVANDRAYITGIPFSCHPVLLDDDDTENTDTTQ
ncbi:MAG: hypothetical protein JSS66_07295 [Armatimonadetes bacterium]|nr:hypothetical protein [Armatimonadota bacterium]